MRIGFRLKGVYLCLLSVQSASFAFAQSSSASDLDYTSSDRGGESTIPSFYRTFDEKNFYHARQIRGMKQDLNEHSRNLYDLRRRFDQVFFGRNLSQDKKAPFRIGPEPQMPVPKDERRKITYIPPLPQAPGRYEDPKNYVNPPVAEPQPQDENLLAFTVQAPGSYLSQDNQVIAPESRSGGSGQPKNFEYYIMPRGSAAYPHKIFKKYNDPRPLYKRYRPGFSAGLSTGVRLDRWRLGFAGIYQENKLHPTSWAWNEKHLRRFDLAGKTSIRTALFEISHRAPISSSFSITLDTGIGYHWRKSTFDLSDGNPINFQQIEITDEDFIWAAGTGIQWSFSQNASLLLSYRYFASKEVPTHNADLGLEFDF